MGSKRRLGAFVLVLLRCVGMDRTGIVSELLKLTGQICLLLAFQRSALKSNSLAG